MRLFIATPISLSFYQSIKNDFKDVLDGKWVEGWNLHLTHKFIGEDNPKKYEIPISFEKLEWKITGIGVLSNRILCLKTNGDNRINKKINEIFGLKNDKSFIPHITLCRIKKIKDMKKFENLLQKRNFMSYRFPVEIYLYQSILTQRGPIYKKLYKYI